jgi:hypothetical protein
MSRPPRCGRREGVRSGVVTSEPSVLRRRSPLAALFGAAALSLLLSSPVAAEDGEEGGEPGVQEDASARIREQMEKIARLMRENEAALLEATRIGGSEPKPVDVKPPDGSERPSGEPTRAGDGSGAAPPEGGTTPPEAGAEIRRRIDELIRGSSERGGRIPRELEELVRMIPTQKGSGTPDPNAPKPDAESRRREAPKEPGEEPSGSKKPEEGQPSPDDDPSRQPPPEGAAGDPSRSSVPPWIQELPPEVRRKIVAQDFESVPEAYRTRIRRYLRWLAEQSRNPER